MFPSLRLLPLLAVALLPLGAAAQPAVHLTTLHVEHIAAAEASPTLSGRFARIQPLTSGEVQIWVIGASPVFTGLAPTPEAASGASKNDALPAELALGTAYPNPVTRRATVPFALPEAAQVRIGLYDVLGREVAVLLDEAREAGRHQTTLDASGLAPGVYFARLATGDAARVTRLTVVR